MPFQKNKSHKPGRRAGKSAREKHQQAKSGPRKGVRNGLPINHSKQERQNTAKQQRENKREQLLHQRRAHIAPRIIAVLPMSKDVNVGAFWKSLLVVCRQSPTDNTSEESLRKVTTGIPGGHKQHVMWLPPPEDPLDPLALIDLTRSIEGTILLFNETAELDEVGELALSIMRHNGLPSLFPAVVPPLGAPLKIRAASKKLAAATLESQGFADQRISLADNAADFQQLLRHIGDTSLKQPLWKQQRSNLVIEAAQPIQGSEADQGTLLVRGYVRSLGLSASRAIHISGIGDFLIDRIEKAQVPAELDAHTSDKGGDQAVRMEEDPAVLATPDTEMQDGLDRENQPNPLDAEQTWPTEEEMADALKRQGKRLLPKGTSAYQAGWILDNDFSDEELEEVDLQSKAGTQRAASIAADLEPVSDGDDDMMDAETSGVAEDEDDEAFKDRRKPSRQDQNDDFQFPDEIDTPEGVPAKERFGKYRGLKSWRTSPWDPKESLPAEYAKIFAFQSAKRAEKRAKQEALRAGEVGDKHAVPVNSYVNVHLQNVPSEKAQSIVERVTLANKGKAAPLTAFGLLQHETRLSVLNFSVKKAGAYEELISNKQELLFVTGFRSYMTKPILSTDEPGASKFKMERFLHPGQNAVATVFAPISYAPLPLLAFSKDELTGRFRLAAAGALKSCNPDRVVLKRIVLSGYPVKVTKKKAVVRWMFHNPDDVRWFRPVELWTKHGLRGRIKEPVGTHGAMKCIFDGGVTQQDAVCASLYKRVFPKWPLSMDFA